MKKIALLFTLLTITLSSSFSQDTLLWLKNNAGIIEDDKGSVIRWENQMENYGDATQAISELGGEQMQETYPGKVNVAFSNDSSCLELEGSNAYFLDNSFSVFYVGKVGNVNSVACLLGNLHVDGEWGKSSGLRFTRKSNGDLGFQFGQPSYKHITLNNLPEDEFFFFGFSLDAQGNYKYFDNSSTMIKTGNINGEIYHNDRDHKLNLHGMTDGYYTYDHTEVAEVQILDDSLSTSQFEAIQQQLISDYPELVKSIFTVEDVTPSVRTEINTTDAITITFSENVEGTSTLPVVTVNKGDNTTSGSWSVNNNQMTFVSDEPWPLGALVSVELMSGLTSVGGYPIDVASRSKYNFIVETAKNFGADTIKFSSIATVDYPQEGHILPLHLVLPEQRDQKVPIHIWVHGGGWSGGTASSSVASFSPHGAYLAKNLGVATLGISYRCNGSSGKFSYAMADIDTAYQWAVRNADVYNFDTTKVFFSGGSAGTPLASLAAQRYTSTVGFIGFNGIYDFVNDQNSFGQWNGYGQETPSAEANSAIFQIREKPVSTILMHGYDDTTIPYTQSTLFADAVVAAGGEAEAVIYPGEVHAFFNIGQQAYEDVLYEMANFVEEILNNDATEIDNTSNDIMGLTVYPNPVKEGDILNITLNTKAVLNDVTVQIINNLGQVIQHNTIGNVQDTLAIHLDSASRGHYIVRVSSNAFQQTINFIVE